MIGVVYKTGLVLDLSQRLGNQLKEGVLRGFVYVHYVVMNAWSRKNQESLNVDRIFIQSRRRVWLAGEEGCSRDVAGPNCASRYS